MPGNRSTDCAVVMVHGPDIRVPADRRICDCFNDVASTTQLPSYTRTWFEFFDLQVTVVGIAAIREACVSTPEYGSATLGAPILASAPKPNCGGGAAGSIGVP